MAANGDTPTKGGTCDETGGTNVENSSAANEGKPKEGGTSNETGCSNVKQSLYGFCDYMIDTTAWNGLGKLRHSPPECKGLWPWVMKIFWVFLLAGCTGLLVWRMDSLVRVFRSWPIHTNFELKFRSRELPALTFCNVNPIRRSHLDNLSCKLQNLLNHSSPACPHSNIAPKGLDTFANKSREILLEIVRQDRDKIEAAGHQIENMLISCTFGGNKCFSGNVSSYFTREWTMDFGNCYTMNTSGMHVYDSGAAAGLDLIFNLETEESLTTYLTGYGMCVVVHERGTQPFPSADGLSASAGFQTHFSLQATCHAERYEGRQMETCNCTDPFSRTSTPSRNASICETAEEFECNARVKEEFKDIVSQEKPYFDCYNPCRETIYDVMFSGRKWPIASLLPVLEEEACRHSQEDISYCMAKKGRRNTEDSLLSFLGLRIYFESLNYERIEQEPFYKVDDFIADLGGMIGLFLGASAVGLFEVIELIAFAAYKGTCWCLRSNVVEKDVKPPNTRLRSRTKKAYTEI